MSNAILAINAGSSSVKFGLYEAADAGDPLLLSKGLLEDAGAEPRFTARDPGGGVLSDRRFAQGTAHSDLLDALLGWIDDHLGANRLMAVGHRIVHGGRDFVAPLRLTVAVTDALDRLTPLAPLHQPRCLEPVRALMALRPGLSQVACFDTAFHHGLAPPVSSLALPRGLTADGLLRRYGFHGLSYEHIAARLRAVDPGLAAGRVVVAHLGSGASLCAMRNGESVDTTMGFSVLDGVVMGTRCGAIDPGVLLYLLRQTGSSAEALEDMLYHRSGLLGVSQVSADLRILLASQDPRAKEAVELFVFSIARQAAIMAQSLQGLDGLVFTGGIGEHSPDIRALVCARLRWLGVDLDPAANAAGADVIAPPSSAIAVRMIAADEEIVLARHAWQTLGPGG